MIKGLLLSLSRTRCCQRLFTLPTTASSMASAVVFQPFRHSTSSYLYNRGCATALVRSDACTKYARTLTGPRTLAAAAWSTAYTSKHSHWRLSCQPRQGTIRLWLRCLTNTALSSRELLGRRRSILPQKSQEIPHAVLVQPFSHGGHPRLEAQTRTRARKPQSEKRVLHQQERYATPFADIRCFGGVQGHCRWTGYDCFGERCPNYSADLVLPFCMGLSWYGGRGERWVTRVCAPTGR